MNMLHKQFSDRNDVNDAHESEFSSAHPLSMGHYYQYPASSYYGSYISPLEMIGATPYMQPPNFGPGPSLYLVDSWNCVVRLTKKMPKLGLDI
jgi:hypothetical protein